MNSSELGHKFYDGQYYYHDTIRIASGKEDEEKEGKIFLFKTIETKFHITTLMED